MPNNHHKLSTVLFRESAPDRPSHDPTVLYVSPRKVTRAQIVLTVLLFIGIVYGIYVAACVRINRVERQWAESPSPLAADQEEVFGRNK
jgi:hypothetical protein